MPSGSYKQVDVKCPFYKYDDGKRRIVCEGIVSVEDSLSSIFRYHEDYERQMTVFCCKDHTKCEIYRMLMGKYEE